LQPQRLFVFSKQSFGRNSEGKSFKLFSDSSTLNEKKKKNQGVVVARQAQLMHSIRIREAEERKKKDVSNMNGQRQGVQ
jgi:hypothetical protein